MVFNLGEAAKQWQVRRKFLKKYQNSCLLDDMWHELFVDKNHLYVDIYIWNILHLWVIKQIFEFTLEQFIEEIKNWGESRLLFPAASS